MFYQSYLEKEIKNFKRLQQTSEHKISENLKKIQQIKDENYNLNYEKVEFEKVISKLEESLQGLDELQNKKEEK